MCGQVMSESAIRFHKIWIEQCEATKDIRESFGVARALSYLIGEKLFSFVEASEEDADFAAELPDFVREIRRIFSAREIRNFLDHLEHDKFLAPDRAPDPHDSDDEPDEQPWPQHPVMGAEELLRFSRIRQLLEE